MQGLEISYLQFKLKRRNDRRLIWTDRRIVQLHCSTPDKVATAVSEHFVILYFLSVRFISMVWETKLYGLDFDMFTIKWIV
jgi:hypothetical protein